MSSLCILEPRYRRTLALKMCGIALLGTGSTGVVGGLA
jgi:hypothetical protein